MRRCKKCNVEILDEAVVCPLCKSVLEQEKELPQEEPIAVGYPDVKSNVKKLNFVVRLYSFLAIVTEVALIAINYLNYNGVWWSAITGISILYFYITLKYSIQQNNGYRSVIWVQVIGAVLLVIAVDNIVGYRGWSVNYVMPGAVLLLDMTIVILMLVNMTNWQSYLLMQICTVLVSVVCLIMWRFDVITRPILSVIAAAVSACLLLATVIFGDRKAKNELKRRFHV